MPALDTEDALDTSSFDPDAYLAQRDAEENVPQGTSTDGFDPDAYLAERDAAPVQSDTSSFDPDAYLAERAAQKVAAANPDVAATTQAVATTPAKTEAAPDSLIPADITAADTARQEIIDSGAPGVAERAKALAEGAGIPTSVEGLKEMGKFLIRSPVQDVKDIAQDVAKIPERVRNLGETLSNSPVAHVFQDPTSPESFGTYGTVIGMLFGPKAGEAVGKVIKGGEVAPKVEPAPAEVPVAQPREVAPESPATEIAQPQTATEPVIKLGLERDVKPDSSLTTLPDETFRDIHKASSEKVDALEKTLDERDLTNEEKQQLASAQDEYSTLELEKFRRDWENRHPGEVLSELNDRVRRMGGDISAERGTENYQKAKILANQIRDTGSINTALEDQAALFKERQKVFGGSDTRAEAFRDRAEKLKAFISDISEPPATFTPTGVANVPTEPIGEPGIVGALEQIRSGERAPKPETAPVEAPAASGEAVTTSTKNEVTASERESRGIAPVEEAAARDFGTVWDEATATSEKDPAAPQRLVESLSEKPRAVTDSENALILRRQIEVQNEYDAAKKAVNDNPGDSTAVERLDKVRDDLQTIYDVNKSIGRESGRGLNARKMLAAQDFSLAKMESEYRAVANEGKPLSEVQTREVEALHERIKLAEGKLAAYESREVFQGALKDARGAKRPFSPVKFLAEQEIAARARILERRGKLYADPIGIQSVAHLADEAIIGASHLARGIKTFGEWSGAMIKDFGEGIKPYLKALFAKSRDIHTQASRLAAAKSRTVTETVKTMSRIGAEDYAPRKVEKIKPDEQLFELRGNLEKARSVYRSRLMERKLAAQTPLQKAGRYTRDVLDISRALKTSFDVSAVLRQGGIMASSHPIMAMRNLKPMFKAFGSEKAQLAKMEEIKARPNFARYNQAKLELTEPGGPLSHQEEVFRGRLAEKIPGVAMSERAYVTFLDSTRADSFDALTASLERKGKPLTPAEDAIIANYINVATGRGPLGKFKDAATALNSVFFAPRWAASRFQYLLGQPMLRDLGNGSPRVRALVAKEYAKTLIGMGTVLGLGIWAGGTVETQPTSPDLGKLKYGNTRLDMMGALPQAAVFISREARAAKRFASGSTEKYPESERGGDVLWRFLRGKLAPIPGEVVNAQQGKNVVGQPVTPKSAVWNLIAPLSYSDVSGALADQGLEKGAILSLMGLFGAGLQTYQKKESSTAPHQLR